VHAPSELCDAAGERQPLATLTGRRVAAFCGIGNPAAFRRTLEAAGCELAWWRELADHHAYTARDLSELDEAVAACDAELVLTTHKDLVKLGGRTEVGGRPLWAVLVEMQIATGLEALDRALMHIAPHGAD
jgi:tetraacyldisaccharide 4'-kinase